MAGLPKVPKAGETVEDVTNLANRGFRYLMGKIRGKDGTTPVTGTADDTTRLSGYERGKARRAESKQDKMARGKTTGAIDRLTYAAGRFPKSTIAGGLGAGFLGASIAPAFSSLIPGLSNEPEYDFGQIKTLSPQEQYLQQQQKIIDDTYGMDATAQVQYQNEANAAAERAAAAYEKLGRPDLAEGARQEVLNNYAMARLKAMAQAAGQRREALGIVRETAAEYSPTRVAPSELRADANIYASSYYSLPEEDRAYYASLGYDTVEKFINGKLNGEI